MSWTQDTILRRKPSLCAAKDRQRLQRAGLTPVFGLRAGIIILIDQENITGRPQPPALAHVRQAPEFLFQGSIPGWNWDEYAEFLQGRSSRLPTSRDIPADRHCRGISAGPSSWRSTCITWGTIRLGLRSQRLLKASSSRTLPYDH